MPDPLSRAITLNPFRQFAIPSANFSRLHARRSHGTAAARDQARPADSLHHSQPTVNDDGQFWKRRKHGFKSLPLSPLMREKDAPAPRTRRAQTPSTDDDDAALKEFQKEISMNPYAQALATPVRCCSLTLAHLPTYFLLPFTTVIEQIAPATDANQQKPPQIKARLQPGRGSDHPHKQTLAQTSYIINRQDAVRHLSRKRHWAFLILERQKTKAASIARRSPGGQKLVQDIWVWDNQEDAMAALLEKRVVAEVKRTSKTAASVEHGDSSEKERMLSLRLVPGVTSTTSPGEANTTTYDLTTLLSSEALASISDHVAHAVAEGVWKVKGPQAWRVRLAIDKLQTYKASNEIQKRLPMVQNPAGSRMPKLFKLGAVSGKDGENVRQ